MHLCFWPFLLLALAFILPTPNSKKEFSFSKQQKSPLYHILLLVILWYFSIINLLCICSSYVKSYLYELEVQLLILKWNCLKLKAMTSYVFIFFPGTISSTYRPPSKGEREGKKQPRKENAFGHTSNTIWFQ